MTEAANKNTAVVKPALSQKPAPLGRGLSALFGDRDTGYQAPAALAAVAPAPERGQKQLAVTWLQPGKFQPRRHFDEAALNELAESIRAHGVLQPLLVRPLHNAGANKFEIIAGERRWRAAQLAGVHEVPVVVRELTDADALEIALIENIQRQDLSPLEEAETYQRLIAEFNHKQDALAKIVGKSRSHIANMMRLLGLPASVKKMLEANELTSGHARALLMAENPEALAKTIVAEKLTVRDVENWIRKPTEKTGRKDIKPTGVPARLVSADILALEKDLTNALGLRVKLTVVGGGGGTLTVAYKDPEQLEGLLERLRG
jgi:ParB family chromosome partitioning protein